MRSSSLGPSWRASTGRELAGADSMNATTEIMAYHNLARATAKCGPGAVGRSGVRLGEQPERERREADHHAEHPVLRPHRGLRAVVEDEGAVVGQDERRDVARHDEAHLG